MAGHGENTSRRSSKDALIVDNGSDTPAAPAAPAAPVQKTNSEPVTEELMLPELRTTILLSSETHTALDKCLRKQSVKRKKNVKKQPVMELALRNFLRAQGLHLKEENDPKF